MTLIICVSVRNLFGPSALSPNNLGSLDSSKELKKYAIYFPQCGLGDEGAGEQESRLFLSIV